MSVRGDRHQSASGSTAAAVAVKQRAGQEVVAKASRGDPAVATVADVQRAAPRWADEQALRGEGHSCSLPPDQRIAGDTPS